MAIDACFLFRGDIRYDTRLDNMARMYVDQGARVTVVQGCGEDRLFRHRGIDVISFRNRERGVFGFVKFWLRASQLAARVSAQTWWASDLYALPVAVWRARMSGGKCGYDSRELFAHLGALRSSPLKQRFWYGLEKILIGRADAVVTSGEMDSDYLEERYGIARPQVVRNVPRTVHVARSHRLHHELAIDTATPICLYSGALQMGRGIGIMLELAAMMPDAAFVFIGDGLLAGDIARTALQLPNVYRIPAVPHDELISYAASATLGFALIEPITLSYLLALPNKMFEYIMAGTPVVASFAPQMEKIVQEFGVGAIVPFDCMGDIHGVVRELLDSPEERAHRAEHCLAAAKVLCWEREEEGFALFARAEGLL